MTMHDAGTAVVTGAAGGLGSAFARALAARGHDLLLADTDGPSLHNLATELGTRWDVTVDTVAGDLADERDSAGLAARVATTPELSFLVNNAGFGTFALFHEADLGTQLAMVRVHVDAAMRLCHAAVPVLLARGQGTIVNVASVSAFWRFPRDATYIGTKAFLVAFTECLAIELEGTGVNVQAFCPAWVHTGFHSTPQYVTTGYTDSPPPFPEFLYVTPDESVASALSAVGKGRVVHTPTAKARLAGWAIGSRAGRLALAWRRRQRANHKESGRW